MSKRVELSGGPVTRRRLLTSGIACAGAAAAATVVAGATPAAAWPQPEDSWAAWAERNVVKKSSREDAGYQPTHSGRESCGSCNNFIAPNRCAVVEGVSNADGLCQLYYRKA